MSNGAASAAYPATGGNAIWGIGTPAYQQQPPQSAQQSPPGPSQRADSFQAPPNGEAPPLLPNMAPDDISDRDTHVPGMAAVALLGVAIALGAALGIPLTVEMMDIRAKMRRDLQLEGFEHVIRDADRTVTEITADWVRTLETHAVDPAVTTRIAAHFAYHWNNFHAADQDLIQAVKTAQRKVVQAGQTAGVHFNAATEEHPQAIDPINPQAMALHAQEHARQHLSDELAAIKTKMQARNNALTRLHDLQLPLRPKSTQPTANALKALFPATSDAEHFASFQDLELNVADPIGTKAGIHGQAEGEISFLYHTFIQELGKIGAKDGDNARLAQVQVEQVMQTAVGLNHQKLLTLQHQGTRSAGRQREFHEKLAKLHEQAVTQFFSALQANDNAVLHGIKNNPVTHDFDVPTHLGQPSLTRQALGFGTNPDFLHTHLQNRVEQFAQKLKAKRFQVSTAKQLRSTNPHIPLPTLSLQELGLDHNLAEGTFHAPRGGAAIRAVTEKFQKNKARVLAMRISARQLDVIHPGAVEHAPHLFPSQDDLTTGRLDDQKKVCVVWEYRPSKSNEIHPEPIKLPDGRLAAAWLVKDEQQTNLKAFDAYTAHVMDDLGGNKHALNTRGVERVLKNLLHYRFHSYGRGLKEGVSVPRFNGAIGANLLITSLPISAVLYGLFYGIDYLFTKYLNEKRKHDKAMQQQQASMYANTSSIALMA